MLNAWILDPKIGCPSEWTGDMSKQLMSPPRNKNYQKKFNNFFKVELFIRSHHHYKVILKIRHTIIIIIKYGQAVIILHYGDNQLYAPFWHQV